MEKENRKEIMDQVFSAINREMTDIDKRIKHHEKWCSENGADPRDGTYILMMEKMALARLYPILRTI